MKKYIVIAITVCLVTVACGKFDRSKIRMPKFTFVTAESLHSVASFGDRLWVSGNYGTVCHSADGGKTWDIQTTGVETYLLGAISFASPTNGWAGGVAGTIIHTTDGGNTWNPQDSGTERDLLDLFFLDTQRGWAVGEYGTAIHTSDGGNTWNPLFEPRDTILNRVLFIDNATGFIVGEFGTILRTADGGASWQEVTCPDLGSQQADDDWAKPLPALYGIFFEDGKRGWITGMDGIILATLDAGMTWRKVPSGTDKPVYSLIVKGSQGWAVGNKGVYLRSSDGGMTWTPDDDAVKTKFWLRDLAMPDGRHGVVVGARGTIAITDDGGTTWDIVSGFRYDMEEFGLADF